MKQIAILIFNQTVDLTTLTGTFQIFERANEFMLSSGKDALFKVELVGLDNSEEGIVNNVNLKTDKTIKEIQSPDLIVIPSNNSPLSVLENNTEAIAWIRDCYAQGSEVASLSTGAFLLASTGLLDGKKCSTHWMIANEFQQIFPKVKLLSQQIVTDERGLYTSGGAYSFLNLILHLLEKYEGRHLAIWAAKMFGIDIDRKDQSNFIVFDGQKDHQDADILEIQNFIEKNYEKKILVSELVERAHMNGRNFIRRFKKATYNTPLEYIQRVKIEAAKRKLESTNMNINEIKYSLSWTDDKSFRNVFKKHTGLIPTAYKQKYCREGF